MGIGCFYDPQIKRIGIREMGEKFKQEKNIIENSQIKMMKQSYFNITLKVILILILRQYVFAQGGWEVKNPLPTESYLLTVEPVMDNKVFIGGLGGTLLKTTNAGETWIVKKFNNLVDIQSISFTDSLNGWLLDSKHLFHTNDGGESWDEVIIDADMSTYFYMDIICFVKTIYLFLKPQTASVWELPKAKSLIYKSTDDGKTWVRLEQEIKGKMNSTFFINESIGFILVNETESINEEYTYLYKISNGGTTWDKRNFSEEHVGVEPGMFFFNEKLGFIGKYRTTDGGVTWENKFNNFDFLSESVKDILFTDSLNGWAVSGTRIFQTTDSGLSWTDTKHYSTHQLTNINFSNNGTGWIVGWAGNIFRKNREINFWESISVGTRNTLNNVFFVNENEGWCVGTNGCILHTSNGGETWQEQNSHIDSVLYKVKFLNNLEGWIAGYYVVLHTADGGKNWETRNDLHGWFVDVDFFDDKHGIIIDRIGKIYYTTNGGIDWQISYHQDLPRITSIAIVNENEAWIGGLLGLGHTFDKGATIQWYNEPNFYLVEDIQFVNNNTGFLYNDYGSFLGTCDGGLTWRELPRGEGLSGVVSTFFVLDVNTVWIYLGIAGGYLKQITSNQTLERTEVPEYWIHPITSIFFINPNIGWAVGSGGTILKYTYTHSPPSEFHRKLINIFPNPFDEGGIHISFFLKQAQKVSVQIYNTIGQRIQTLHDGLLNEGNNKLFWKPSIIASGIYFISIRCNEINQTQKCIFIHH